MEEAENSDPQGNARAAWVKQIMIGAGVVILVLGVAVMLGLTASPAPGRKDEDVHSGEWEDVPGRHVGGGPGRGNHVPRPARRSGPDGQNGQLSAPVEAEESAATVAAAEPAEKVIVAANTKPASDAGPDAAQEREQVS